MDGPGRDGAAAAGGSEDAAVSMQNVSKSFQIMHEKRDSIFEYLASLFRPKSFAEVNQVLDDVSFSVKKGEMFGILGLNGSGKSTLLKIIAHVYSPDAGRVVTRGKITPFLELGTGFNIDLTARDNVILYATILGLSKQSMLSRMDRVFSFAELTKYQDTKIKNFSTGMVARLAFATAMEVDPDILLVDEILSVGDISFQEKSFNAFMDFKRRGKTIVFVTHSLDQIRKNCNRAMWIDGGRIRAIGDAGAVSDEYEKFAMSL